MNERIKELALQAGLELGITLKDYATPVKSITIEQRKFAELIVKECALQCFDLADKLPTGDFPAGLKMLAYNIAGETIKEHFGVEE
jgi:hypothetical protein